MEGCGIANIVTAFGNIGEGKANATVFIQGLGDQLLGFLLGEGDGHGLIHVGLHNVLAGNIRVFQLGAGDRQAVAVRSLGSEGEGLAFLHLLGEAVADLLTAYLDFALLGILNVHGDNEALRLRSVHSLGSQFRGLRSALHADGVGGDVTRHLGSRNGCGVCALGKVHGGGPGAVTHGVAFGVHQGHGQGQGSGLQNGLGHFGSLGGFRRFGGFRCLGRFGSRGGLRCLSSFSGLRYLRCLGCFRGFGGSGGLICTVGLGGFRRLGGLGSRGLGGLDLLLNLSRLGFLHGLIQNNLLCYRVALGRRLGGRRLGGGLRGGFAGV